MAAFQALNIVVILLTAFQISYQSADTRQTAYTQSDRPCDFYMRLDHGCIHHALDGLSALDCARECAENYHCIGFSVHISNQSCYVHDECEVGHDMATTCTGSAQEFRHYDRHISAEQEVHLCNGGVWDHEARACSCSGGLVDTGCHRLAHSCSEFFAHGYDANTRHVVETQPEGAPSSIITACTMSENSQSLTAIAYYNDSSDDDFDFAQDDYINGIVPSQNAAGFTAGYWMGLENIHQISSRGNYSFLIIYTFSHSTNGDTQFFIEFEKFSVTGGSDKYRATHGDVLSYGRPETDSTLYFAFDDCFTNFTGVQFSTPGDDNDDEVSIHCADVAQSGWWFKQCEPAPIVACAPFAKDGAFSGFSTQWNANFGMLEIEWVFGDYIGATMYLSQV